MTLWMIHGVPVIDHGPKIQWGDVFEVLSISEPGRDVSRSRQTFQITDEHVKIYLL